MFASVTEAFNERIGLLAIVENPSVESLAMSREKQQYRVGRSAWVMVAIFTITLVLMLSITLSLGSGHGFDQVTLALPVFFVFLLLATLISGWLQIEDFFLEPKPQLSASLTRGPPA